MTPRRRLGLALLCLTPVLGCVGNCEGEGDGPPDTRTCSDDDPSHAVDSIAVSARREVGGQGTTMLVFDVEYTGDDPPDCARVDYVYSDPTGTVGSGTILVSTDEGAPRSRVARDIWDPWPGGEWVRVTVTSAGQSASACAGPCDAGTDDAGTDDAGTDDAGP